jgi:N-acyl amino acid synthase of PEP-CTERM/exosortase system
MGSTGPTEVNTPGDNFGRYFEIVPALTSRLKDEVFKIRHQVYCEDLGFEAQRPDRRESDTYDAQSLHLLIRSVHAGDFVGCTRIVRVRPGDPQPAMPFEHACAGAIDLAIVDPAALPRHAVGEISRLAVVARYRRRKGEAQQPVPVTDSAFADLPRPRFPYLLVGLYLGTIELARVNNITTLFVLTEPRLASHLARIGVEIKAIGDPVEHHGTRVPSVMNTSDILDNLKPLFRPLYLTIAKEIAAGL